MFRYALMAIALVATSFAVTANETAIDKGSGQVTAAILIPKLPVSPNSTPIADSYCPQGMGSCGAWCTDTEGGREKCTSHTRPCWRSEGRRCFCVSDGC
jgi:hypothetical protein